MKWGSQELDYIRRYIDVLDWHQIAAHFGTTKSCVRQAAHRNRIVRSAQAIYRLRGKSHLRPHWIVRFWSQVAFVEDDTSCWLWQGRVLWHGYGDFFSIEASGDGSRSMYAHRLAYRLATGELNPMLFVCHKCDVKLCVRPSHLFAGTSLDNQRDMAAKDRSVFGERCTFAKLTAAEVLAIRERYAQGGISQEALGRQFNVSATAVQAIVNHRSWRRLSKLAWSEGV